MKTIEFTSYTCSIGHKTKGYLFRWRKIDFIVYKLYHKQWGVLHKDTKSAIISHMYGSTRKEAIEIATTFLDKKGERAVKQAIEAAEANLLHSGLARMA